jgi:ABC-type multidrug transport system fused ATPase/permease subunit
MTVKKLFKVHKKTLIIILLLVIVENVAWIIEPTVFGNVIDEFINKSYSRNLRFQSHHMQLLLMWILLYAINSISGTVRRRMEPKVFQNMNTDIAIKISEAVRENKIEPEKGAARAQLAEQIVSFFQFRIPEILEQSLTFGGAIIALTFIDWRISVVCLLVGVPLIIINIIYNKKVSVLQTELHDNYENVYETFSTKNPENVKNRFNKMGSVQRKIGNWSAINFGSLRLILLIIFIFVLYIAIDLDDFTTGKIYSIVAYLWSFIGTVEYLPDLMESATSLRDIKNRI